MTPEYLRKWEHVLDGVDKSSVPVQFMKRIVVRMVGKKQHTINIQLLLKQGLAPDEIEEVIARKLTDLDPLINSIYFDLNVEGIAATVQPETDKLLNKL
jgi:hypothetical protein